MATREIPKSDWKQFSDMVSDEYQGWLTTVETRGADRHLKTVAEDLPFEGISIDDKADVKSIEVAVGNDPDDHIGHVITHPTHMRLEEGSDPNRKTLHIESTGGDTVVSLRANRDRA